MSDQAPTFEIEVNGVAIPARPGDTVAVALWNSGNRVLRLSPQRHGRGVLCAMGCCFECRAEIDGRLERTCLVRCQPGMKVDLSV